MASDVKFGDVFVSLTSIVSRQRWIIYIGPRPDGMAPVTDAFHGLLIERDSDGKLVFGGPYRGRFPNWRKASETWPPS